MSNHAHIAFNSLDLRTRRKIKRAKHLLDGIQAGGEPAELIRALECFAPVAGGMIGTMGAELTGSAISHVVALPGFVVEAWATTPLEQLRLMMAPLVCAAPGDLISDRTAIKDSLRDELLLLEVMHSAGFGESAGYKVSEHTVWPGRPEHRFLTIALEHGQSFGDTERAVFHFLQPKIEQALARMALPLVPHERGLERLFAADDVGYLCLSNSCAVIESNRRADELVSRYRQAAQIENGRDWFRRFVERVLIETAGGARWYVDREDRLARLEISMLGLPREVHNMSQEVNLVIMRESEKPFVARLQAANLTSRQREITYLLVTTKLVPKEIATRLNREVKTIDKHIQNIFARCEVSSRAELMLKFLM